jgi:hypothetical protein
MTSLPASAAEAGYVVEMTLLTAIVDRADGAQVNFELSVH